MLPNQENEKLVLEQDSPLRTDADNDTEQAPQDPAQVEGDLLSDGADFAPSPEAPVTPVREQGKRERIKGVFSTQSIEKVGTGTTVRRTIQKTFWMAEEGDDGHIQIQPLNVNYVPSGPKRTVAKDDLLRQFSPEPEFYMSTVFPAMQRLKQTVQLGEEHRKKGRNFSAEHEFQTALTVDEENVRANFGLGLTYLERGERKKADNIFERLVNLDAAFEPEHKHLFNDFGISLRKNSMFDQAVDYYRRALELSKADEHLHYNIARAHFSTQQLDKTVEHLQKALSMNTEFEVAKQFLDWLKSRGYVSEDGQVNPDAKLAPEDSPGFTAPQDSAPDAGDASQYKMDI